jgi:excisionase family DNA binding protein
MNQQQLLTIRDVATRLALSQRTIYKLLDAGVLPPAIRFGRARRWRIEDIDAAIARIAERTASAASSTQPSTRTPGRPRTSRQAVRS